MSSLQQGIVSASQSSRSVAGSHLVDDDDAAGLAFPKAGVKFSYIIGEFFQDVLGGTDQLQGLTTSQFCEDVIKPLTVDTKSSYCSILKSQGHAAYGEKAEVFISHVHGYTFLDFISALQWRLRDEPDAIVWIDLFSINQHAPKDWTFEWLSTTFKSAVELMGRTIMVMSPWDSPLPFTRAWCVFEAYCTTATGSKFEIAVSKTDEQIFLQDMERDPVGRMNSMFATISSRDSQSSVEDDRIRIFSVIRETVGFHKLDSLVFERYRDWVIQVSVEALSDCTDEEESLKLLKSVGFLYTIQGKYVEAEKYIRERVELSKYVLGEDHPDTLAAIHHFALMHSAQARYRKARSLYEHCLERRKTVLGASHQETLRTMSNVGVVLCEEGKYMPAQDLLETCYCRRSIFLGKSHPETFESMIHLAEVYAKQDDEDNAEDMYRTCLKRQQKVFPQDDPRILTTMISLGAFLAQHGTYRDSQLMLAYCLKRLRVVLGDDNPDTLKAAHNLATLYENLGKYEEAHSLYESCLATRKTVFGESHPLTLSTMHGLAVVLCHQGNDSQSMLESCLEEQRGLLGLYHPDTLVTERSLAMVHYKNGRIGKAHELCASCYKVQKTVLGENHRESLKTANTLTMIRDRQDKMCLSFASCWR